MSSEQRFRGNALQHLPQKMQPISGVETSVTAFIGFSEKGPIDSPVTINNFNEFENIFGSLNNDYPMSFSIADFFDNGGRKAIVIRIDFGSGKEKDTETIELLYKGNRQKQTGIYALEKINSFNIICIPPPSREKDIGKSVIRSAANYCEERLALLLIDSPRSWKTLQNAVSDLSNPALNIGTNSFHAAIFYPRILKSNPLSPGKIDEFAPSGMIAGVISRLDKKKGVWNSTSGSDAEIKSKVKLSKPLSDTELNLLVSLGCNCLKSMPPDERIVIWGGRTLQGKDILSSEWKYIPVHRLGMYIEDSVYKGTLWVVNEPNDERLWSKIRINVKEFMHKLYMQGAIKGNEPKEAYFVKCDSETTTENDKKDGKVNFWIGFAPLKPAEFIILHIQQKTNVIEDA
jgi:phage tail sheath protein FI